MPEGTQVAVLLLSNDLVAGRQTSFGCWLLAWLVHDGRVSVGSSSLRNSLALAPPRGDMADQVAPKFKNSIYRNGMANRILLVRSHTIENRHRYIFYKPQGSNDSKLSAARLEL
jgi:hypothetical protein